MRFTVCSVAFVCCLVAVLGLAARQDPEEKARGDTHTERLSVLLLASIYIGHQFPLLALGEELVSRGHRVAVMGPLIESSTVLSNLSQDVGVEFINVGFVSKKALAASADLGKDFTFLLHGMTFGRQTPKDEEDVFDFLVMLKDGVDSLNGLDWDYVVANNAAVVILYYIMQNPEWKHVKVMGNASPMGSAFGALPPWPTPLVPIQENMSFKERLLNTILAHVFSTVVVPLLNRLIEGQINIGGSRNDYMRNMGITHPLLINTVLGFDYPKTRPPLVHYTGPMLLKSYPPLDPELLEWLKGKESKSVVYISMGSAVDLTPELGRSILNGIHNYSIVWSLRKSNQYILEGVDFDRERVFIAEWVSQVTLLQHESVAMAMLHCGMGGVQEALYNRVPVICIPIVFDQFDVAARVEFQGFGVRLFPTEVTPEGISDAVSKVGSGRFQDKVNKISVVLKHVGGAKKAADLVELYSEVGHQHGIPAFVKYEWSWIQHYNVDVWAVLLTVVGVMMWVIVRCFKLCFRKCCSMHPKKSKKD